MVEEKISFFNKTFWDLFLMKIFRNFASMKYQWLVLMYLPVIWGMFTICSETNIPWISAKVGLAFLGGGFVTLATSRIVARTKLVDGGKNDNGNGNGNSNSKNVLDTDK